MDRTQNPNYRIVFRSVLSSTDRGERPLGLKIFTKRIVPCLLT